MLFFRHVAILLLNCATIIFLSKTEVLFYILYILKNNKTDSEKMSEEVLIW